MASRRIGQIFVDLGFITDKQLELLLEEQQQQPGILLGKLAKIWRLSTRTSWPQRLQNSGTCKLFAGEYEHPAGCSREA